MQRARGVRLLHSSTPQRQQTGEAALLASTETALAIESEAAPRHALSLPPQCTGCGALSQTSEPSRAGYFSLDRKDVRRHLGHLPSPADHAPPKVDPTDQIVQDALKGLDLERLAGAGVDVETLVGSAGDVAAGAEEQEKEARRKTGAPERSPLCDRCHRLVHHSTGESIYHPSIEAIRETIEESPYKYNHVYHVIDAADFPMSLLPQIRRLLSIMPLRSRNRRSRAGKFYSDRKVEVSFVITRSDLLAPTKEQVDRLLPKLREILRDALGRIVQNARVGTVRCVSAKRSWWTKELKEDIWKLGGAVWMVGKVNVGKSQLFEAVFPKGRMKSPPAGRRPIEIPLHSRHLGEEDHQLQQPGLDAVTGQHGAEEDLEIYSLLPPARPETNYPEMPVVSSLPGTTASPIRVPFGDGKGELIDLPGLERSGLDMYVQPEHRGSLLMKSRITPVQEVLKPYRSLLLGGFIRLTPRTPDLIFLTYNFTPLKAHRTNTEKAISIMEQTGELNVENISLPGTGARIKLAGSFPLRWDMTKERTGPITRRDAAHISIEKLPYRVLATDILIEGCGWVEVVAQVRTVSLFKPRRNQDTEQRDPFPRTLDLFAEPSPAGEPNWPIIDVYSPEGRFVDARRPINSWEMNKSKGPDHGRPRKAMKGVKKRVKAERRAAALSSGSP